MPRKYLDNPYIKHYLEETDAFVDEYLAARNREDWDAVRLAVQRLEGRGAAIRKRIGKISDGRGREENTSGWNPPEPQKQPPKAVRAEDV